jgi:hypothetical protein
MCGGYSKFHSMVLFTSRQELTCFSTVNRDDFISKYRMLNLTKEEHAASTMTG